jgi:hypothetical protein
VQEAMWCAVHPCMNARFLGVCGGGGGVEGAWVCPPGPPPAPPKAPEARQAGPAARTQRSRQLCCVARPHVQQRRASPRGAQAHAAKELRVLQREQHHLAQLAHHPVCRGKRLRDFKERVGSESTEQRQASGISRAEAPAAPARRRRLARRITHGAASGARRQAFGRQAAGERREYSAAQAPSASHQLTQPCHAAEVGGGDAAHRRRLHALLLVLRLLRRLLGPPRVALPALQQARACSSGPACTRRQSVGTRRPRATKTRHLARPLRLRWKRTSMRSSAAAPPRAFTHPPAPTAWRPCPARAT